MPNDFFTLDYLATFAGMVVAVAMAVQFTKGMVKKTFQDWVVRVYALFWAWLILAFVLYVRDMLVVEYIGLAVLNGILVASSALGIYETLADPKAEKGK